MMCYEENVLQAWLDGEINDQTQVELQNHLAECGPCRAKLAQLHANQGVVEEAMSGYLNSFTFAPSEDAWNRLSTSLPHTTKFPMWKGVNLMFRKHRVAAVAATVLLAAGLSLSLGPVRSAAADFLSIFRVEKMQTVDLSTNDIKQIAKVIRQGSGQVKLGNVGQFQYQQKGSAREVSLTQAKTALDFPLRLPAYLPAGYNMTKLTQTPGGSMSFSLDTEKANQIIKGLGSNKLLPAALNGETFTVQIPTVITTSYNGPNRLMLAEARSPELTAPGDASVTAIRDALLALPVLPPDLRNQLAAINDWQHTFLVPSIDGSSQTVTVDGCQGVFITRPAQVKTTVQNALVWQKNGVVYALTGAFDQTQGLQIANSLK